MKVILNYLFVFVLSFFFLTCAGCKKDLSPIEKKEEPVCQLPTDTTSHEFTWTVDTLGGQGSYLKDVAIISENETWVVGNLHLYRYPNPNQYDYYNCAKWNGSEWTYSLLPLVSVVGNDTAHADIYAIFSTNKDNIWVFSSAGSYGYWNGNKWKSEIMPSRKGSINDIWGTGPDNMFFVGNHGTIVHYNGQTFKSVFNQVDDDFKSISGFYDERKDKTHIWVSGTRTLLYSEGGAEWQIVFEENNTLLPQGYVNPTCVYALNECHVISTIWGYSDLGLFLFDNRNLSEYKIIDYYNIFPRGLSGNGMNDIFFVGDFNRVGHYNGKSIQDYPELAGGGIFHSVAFDSNNVYVVGSTGVGWSAVVARGTRKNK